MLPTTIGPEFTPMPISMSGRSGSSMRHFSRRRLSSPIISSAASQQCSAWSGFETGAPKKAITARSEEYTSELQSRGHLVCRLLLEKKKKRTKPTKPRNAPEDPELFAEDTEYDFKPQGKPS